MSTDYRSARQDFSSIVKRLQPMVLSNFVLWLDLKVAEFKVYGQMLLAAENEFDISRWFIQPLLLKDNHDKILTVKQEIPASCSSRERLKHLLESTISEVPDTKVLATEHFEQSKTDCDADKSNPVQLLPLEHSMVDNLNQLKNQLDSYLNSASAENILGKKQITAESSKEDSKTNRPAFIAHAQSYSGKPSQKLPPNSPKIIQPISLSSNIEVESSNVQFSAISPPFPKQILSVASDNAHDQNTETQCGLDLIMKKEPVEEVENEIESVTDKKCMSLSSLETDCCTETISNFKDDDTDSIQAAEKSGRCQSDEALQFFARKRFCTSYVDNIEKSSSQSRATNSVADVRRSSLGIDFHVVMKDHQRFHQCLHCSYETRYQQNMKRHQRMHTGNYFRCELCNNRFYDTYALNMHMKAHSGKLACRLCGKRFSNTRGLNDHEKRHLGDYKYTCSVCGKQFMIRSIYRKHLASHSPSLMFLSRT